jgi:hypothetical protein
MKFGAGHQKLHLQKRANLVGKVEGSEGIGAAGSWPNGAHQGMIFPDGRSIIPCSRRPQIGQHCLSLAYPVEQALGDCSTLLIRKKSVLLSSNNQRKPRLINHTRFRNFGLFGGFSKSVLCSRVTGKPEAELLFVGRQLRNGVISNYACTNPITPISSLFGSLDHLH